MYLSLLLSTEASVTVLHPLTETRAVAMVTLWVQFNSPPTRNMDSFKWEEKLPVTKCYLFNYERGKKDLLLEGSQAIPACHSDKRMRGIVSDLNIVLTIRSVPRK
jgi:hypothetical protein